MIYQPEHGMAKPRIKHNTWVVVADGGRALIMRNDGDAEAPQLTVLRKHSEHVPRTREQGSDKPGRTNASVGVNRSAMEQTDWHQQAEDNLMREVAEGLLADLRRQEFSSLILAAAPVALGTLRRAMSDEVKSKIVAEVDKDLTKMPVPEIGATLAKALEAA
jgi:protein required for attachment to host cells